MARKATRKAIPGKAARAVPASKARPAARAARPRATASDARRIELVLRAINEGVYDWDVASNTVYYSDWVRRALGLSEQELRTPSDWRDRIHPEDVARFDAALIAHFKGQTDRFQCEFRYRSADGSWRWARQQGFSMRDRRGRAVRMIGSTGDITELKQATEALRASEERYALATRAATEGVYEWDLATGRLFISDTTKLFFWSKDATLTPDSWNDRVHPDDFAAYRGAIKEHFLGRTAQFEHEYRIRGADGAYLWVLDRGVGVRDAGGRVTKFVGAVSDITPRKDAEAAALRAHEETTRALERQTATAEILKVIASTPSDVQPVFDAIARNCGNLFPGSLVLLWLIEDGVLRARAITGAGDLQLLGDRLPIDRGSAVGTCVVESRMVHLPDLEKALGMHPRIRQLGLKWGHRSGIYAPLMREARAIGAIAVLRPKIGAFDNEEVALLNTFANQAVIAIENVRLFNETREALERQTATAEILRVISNSPADTQPVFEAILEKATQLCEAEMGILFSYDGEQYRAMSMRIPDPAFAAVFREPRRAGPATGLGRIARDLKSVHIHDVLDDAAYHQADPMRLETVRLGGVRTWLGVPMLKDGALIGAIVIYRKEVRPFATRQTDLLETFADQAVIAIENVRLFNETREALERQTATAEILKVIASSPDDVQPVFDAIAERARVLCGAEVGSATRFDGEWLHMVSYRGASPEAEAAMRAAFPVKPGHGSVNARAIVTAAPAQVPDILLDPDYQLGAPVASAGLRSMLGVPMLHAGQVIGVIGLGRTAPGRYSEKSIALLQTFADQAVIAIENVRLFTETREALERQRATSDVLASISGSMTDAQPVFDRIVRNVRKLFGTRFAVLQLLHGTQVEMPALDGDPGFERLRENYPRPLDDTTVGGRAMLEKRVVQFTPVIGNPTAPRAAQEFAREIGFDSVLFAPMVHGDQVIGAIGAAHPDAKPFDERQVALIRTFADQAVIAIANVRLFNTIRQRNEDLARLLERQTAMADLLRAAAASPADVRPVLNALAEHAARLCSATYVNVLLEDRGRLHTMAVFSGTDGPPTDLGFSMPATPATVNGRAFLERRSIHVEDFAALAETEYPDALAIQRQFGFRTILGVPMLREGKAIGTISIWRREVRPFAPEEIALMQTFANQAVIAIENTRLLHEVQAKSAQLEIANQHKSDFLAHMSHELRTPLNAIIGFSEVLGERYFGELTDKQDEYVKDIHSSGKHLLSLINDILDLSKIEAGRMELEPSDFDLRAAIDNALTLVKERAQRHGLALHCEIDDALGALRADERKFKQVLVNLLSNAVKFTPDGGAIRVRARPAGTMVEIAVSDTGPGIAPEDQAAVFEEFKQVGPASAAKAEGTGLGMPLTKRIVELHGGSIRLESAPGQGATFTVCLPLSGAP